MKEAIEEVGPRRHARSRALPDHARHDRRDGAAAGPLRHRRRHDRDLRLADARPASNPIQLAHGISIALYNTAFGLIVAIPSMIFYRHFRAKVDGADRRDGAAGDPAGRLRPRRAQVGRHAMNLRGTRTRDDPEINFIPLIDVLLVILIFLMVTTTYQRVAELQITLPEADADAGEAAAEGDQRRRRRAGTLRDRPDRVHVHDGRRARRRAASARPATRRTRCHHQRRRQRDAPVGDPRDGSRARGRPHPHHVRDAGAGEVSVCAPPRGRDAVEPVRFADRLVAAWYAPRLTAADAAARAAVRGCSAPSSPCAAPLYRARLAARRSACRVPVVVVGNITRRRQRARRRWSRRSRARSRARGWRPGHRQPRLRRRRRPRRRGAGGRGGGRRSRRGRRRAAAARRAAASPVAVGARPRRRGARAARRASASAT